MDFPQNKIHQLKSLFKEMFKYLPNLMPVVVIFVVAFSFSILGNFYFTQQAVQKDGHEIISILERYIDRVASELFQLNSQLSGTCSEDDKLALRAHAFNSDYIKEVGVYQNGYVTCTSQEGPSRIRLSYEILERIAHSNKGITIAVENSMSHLKTFFVYASINDSWGLNALLPPERFTNLIAKFLDTHKYQYNLTVLDYHIGNLEPSSTSLLSPVVFKSELYPFSIELLPTFGTYKYNYFNNMWQTILAASACALLYLIIGYRLLARRSIEFNLLNAIRNEEIELYLQPIIDINTNSMVGSEALVRWNHPTQGNIPPSIFVPLAEKLGAINSLTENMLSMVAKFLNQYPQYQASRYVSVNVSRISLIDDNFYNSLKNFTEKNPKLVESILLEVTENLDFDQQQLSLALNNLKRIRDLGFQLAIDDFGTGYSGLNFIRLHPFQVMKIDQVFIKSLHSESNITPVLVSMIQLAKELKMRVIAEGVENEQQLELLRKLGVHYIQGYYYSYPIKPDALITLTDNYQVLELEEAAAAI